MGIIFHNKKLYQSKEVDNLIFLEAFLLILKMFEAYNY